MDEKELREKIEKKPLEAMNYYYLGKELMGRPISMISSVDEIEDLFRKALELSPRLWAPRTMLGELLFKLGRYKDAEWCFRDVLKYFPDSTSAREFLAKCIEARASTKAEIKETPERDVLYLFENNIREFIRSVLEKGHGSNWWRKGIPQQVRAKCASKREEGLEEEKDADLLLFTDFRNYKAILDHQPNKKFFSKHFDIKEWGKTLYSIEPIRNAIAHNHPLPKSASKIKTY
ncbi:unnamed protein product, partial [marine sediment metagenome]